MSGNRGLDIRLAGPDDAADLAAIYASDDGFPGRIRVSFRRGDDPLASLRAEGERVLLPLVREASTGRPVGMGACVIRRSTVAGRERTVGYLTGLKVVPGFRRSPLALPRMYAYLREQAPDVELFTTTILDENRAAIGLLERGHRGMPQYRRVGQVSTFAFRGGWPVPGRHRLTRGTLDELLTVRATEPPADLALHSAPAGLSRDDVWLLRDRAGRVLAGCAVWDQRAHKQHVVTGYGGAHAVLSRLPVHLLGLPRYPRPGAVTDGAAITLAWARGQDPHLLRELLRGVGRAERRRDYLLVAGLRGGPVARAMAGQPAVRYGSRLYTVHFPDSPELGLDPGNTDVEVGLL